MAKGDFHINVNSQFIGPDEWLAAEADDATDNKPVDLSQIAADLEKLPEAPSFAGGTALAALTVDEAHYWASPSVQDSEKMFATLKKALSGAPSAGYTHTFKPKPLSPLVIALRRAADALEERIEDAGLPGGPLTVEVPIAEPPTLAVYDAYTPPKLSFKRLTVTIRLEE